VQLVLRIIFNVAVLLLAAAFIFLARRNEQ
jgi:hypothetical protein